MYKLSAKTSVEELCFMIPKSHSVHPPPAFSAGGLSLQSNFQKGGAWQDLNFQRRVAGKERDDFFRGSVGYVGGVQFLHKK